MPTQRDANQASGSLRNTPTLVRDPEKLGFYAAHGVDESLIVDGQERHVHWLGLQRDGTYGRVDRSTLTSLGSGELAERTDWPE